MNRAASDDQATTRMQRKKAVVNDAVDGPLQHNNCLLTVRMAMPGSPRTWFDVHPRYGEFNRVTHAARSKPIYRSPSKVLQAQHC